MSDYWWFLLGMLAALAGMAPLLRLLLRRNEKRARRAERRARDAERLAELGSMTGGLAHEIKNPLSTIGLNAQLLAEELRDAELPADQRERLLRRLEALARETQRLRGILTDFLQFAGRIKLDPQRRDVGGMVAELADFFHPQCDQAGITLRTQLPSEPAIANVDEGLFKQAMLNLMLNAVQAMLELQTPRGSSRGDLMLRVESDAGEICVHVTDTGPGIEQSRLEEVFRPYVTSKSGGTGLGLPTARRIIEEHGGRLSVHTEVGRGSDFVVHLPRAE